MKIDILAEIVAEKRREVAHLRPTVASVRKDDRDFTGVLLRQNGVALIAEVKKASPSAGIICADFDPVKIAREYEAAGATALSVLTDEKFFQGRLEYLRLIRQAVQLPLLRKDFIIDERQLHETATAGADAVLLIVAILDDAQLKDYQTLAGELHLAALVEVHDDRELDRALNANAEIIGINNRDLKTFRTDLATTEKLAARIPTGKIIVAESGINSRADVQRVTGVGARAILVGESLMRSRDIASKMQELLG